MTERSIVITKYDKKRLSSFNREGLKKELDRAIIVDPTDIPEDTITMNSKFRLKDLNSDEDLTYTLVFPEEENMYENKVSILAPMGMALLGYKVNDIVEWPVPSGTLRVKILEVLYQPEASGDYNL